MFKSSEREGGSVAMDNQQHRPHKYVWWKRCSSWCRVLPFYANETKIPDGVKTLSQ